MNKSTLQKAIEEIKSIFSFKIDKTQPNHYVTVGNHHPAPLGFCPNLVKCLEVLEETEIDFKKQLNCDGDKHILFYDCYGEIYKMENCHGCDNCRGKMDSYAYLKEWKEALEKAGVKSHFGPHMTSSSSTPILFLDEDDIDGFGIQPNDDDSHCSGFREAVTRFVFGEWACYVPYCAPYVSHLSWTGPRGWALMVTPSDSMWPVVIGRGRTKIETLLNALKETKH